LAFALSAAPDRLEDATTARAIALLRAGGVALLPTDTIYGFSCRFGDREARARLLALKGGDRSPTFIALVSNLDMAERYGRISDRAREFLRDRWPGPVTAILPAHVEVADDLVGPNRTVALRWPRIDRLADLVAGVGEPLLSTSANRHGDSPVRDAVEAWRIFGAEVDLYLDAGPLEGAPSALVDLTGDEPVFLRGGP